MSGKSSIPSRQTMSKTFVAPFRVEGPKKFDLAAYPTAAKGGIEKDTGRDIIAANRERLQALQETLYAQDRWSLLLIFQGMDASGKDSAIKSVFEGVNPQGCDVASFKTPSTLELEHDFMWRSTLRLPERGRIGIFNRSYYEECLVVRVHKELLAKQKLPPELVTDRIWTERFEDISAFERYLSRNGTLIIKFFLHVSKDEQRKRFLDRLDEPSKNWKFSMQDVAERAHWETYQHAYADMIANTASKAAPWIMVPADHKWFARVVIGSAIVQTLEGLDLKVPGLDNDTLKAFSLARTALEQEGGKKRRETSSDGADEKGAAVDCNGPLPVAAKKRAAASNAPSESVASSTKGKMGSKTA
jgi:PPK2 family polyphosphate:nucleotide phosphotransferase